MKKLFNKIYKQFKEYNDNVKFELENKKSIFWLLGIIIFVVIWEIIVRLILLNPDYRQFHGFLPSTAFKTLIILVMSNNFWSSVIASFIRILLGLFIASCVGIPLGLMIGFYGILRKLTNVPIQFIRMISPLSWMPIAIIILPGFQEAILFIITISAIWPIVINTCQGVLNVNPDWIKIAKNQGAKDHQLLYKVILPASLPYILTGFRLAVGIGWIVLVPAELLGISSGLGYLINDARDTMAYDKLMAVVISIGIIGSIIDWFLQFIQKKFDWRV